MDTKKEEEGKASLSGEVIEQVKEELQLRKLQRIPRTWWDFHVHPEKMSQAIVSNSWSNYLSPISYYCIAIAGYLFTVPFTGSMSLDAYDRLTEPLMGVLMFVICVLPASCLFHLALGKRRRKLRDVIHFGCYAQANWLFLRILGAPFIYHTATGQLAIHKQPDYLHALGIIYCQVSLVLFVLLIVRSAQILMRMFNISFWRLIGTACMPLLLFLVVLVV